jgi:hypothetical protein
MISDRIKQNFASAILEKEAQAIRQEQLQVVADWNLFDSGVLKEMLQGHFSVTDLDRGTKLSMAYVAYARFLDIKSIRRKRDSYHLYNRIVFGHLYHPILNGLRYGLTMEIYQTIKGNIEEVMNINPQLGAMMLSKLRK